MLRLSLGGQTVTRCGYQCNAEISWAGRAASLREYATLCRLMVVGGYQGNAEIARAWSAGPMVTSLREFAKLCRLMVVGGYQGNAEIARAWSAGPMVTSLREFAKLCRRVVVGDYLINPEQAWVTTRWCIITQSCFNGRLWYLPKLTGVITTGGGVQGGASAPPWVSSQESILQSL